LIFTEKRGVRVEEYAYYVNKLRRQIVTSQKVHTKYKWPAYGTEWNPHENFLRTPLIIFMQLCLQSQQKL